MKKNQCPLPILMRRITICEVSYEVESVSPYLMLRRISNSEVSREVLFTTVTNVAEAMWWMHTEVFMLLLWSINQHRQTRYWRSGSGRDVARVETSWCAPFWSIPWKGCCRIALKWPRQREGEGEGDGKMGGVVGQTRLSSGSWLDTSVINVL
jgi:hypothetical protein